MNRSFLSGLLVGVAVAAAAAGGYGLHGVRPTAPSAERPVALAAPDPSQPSFVAVAQQVRPAVVNVGIVQRGRVRRGPAAPGSDDPFFQDFLRQFFGSEGPAPGGRPE